MRPELGYLSNDFLLLFVYSVHISYCLYHILVSNMVIRIFQKNKFLLFVNGDKNVAVYGPYEANKKIIGIIEAFPLKCTTFLYIQRKFQKIQRKSQYDL